MLFRSFSKKVITYLRISYAFFWKSCIIIFMESHMATGHHVQLPNYLVQICFTLSTHLSLDFWKNIYVFLIVVMYLHYKQLFIHIFFELFKHNLLFEYMYIYIVGYLDFINIRHICELNIDT